MLAHAGGAATLDAPPWLLAYAAAAVVLLVTVAVRGRFVVAAARRATGPADTHPGPRSRPATANPAIRVGRVVGRAVGVGALAVVVVAAFAGPDAPGANLAPSAVLAVWWVGLPLACVAAGDVMRWLDPFGTLAGLAGWATRASGRGTDGRRTVALARGAPWTAAASFAAFAWWALAYREGREPRTLGWFLVAYCVAAVAGALAGGPGWLRRGEGFGALSAALARARRATVGRAADTEDDDRDNRRVAFHALVAVWLGAVAFDLFSGTRAWVELAGSTSGVERTARATACLATGVAAGWLAVAATRRVASGRGTRRPDGTGAGGDGTGAGGTDGTVVLAWVAVAAGAFLSHALTLLLVDGQIALALASDPFGRGWDLFGTARRTIDYSPFSPGVVGALQLGAAVGGGVWAVLAAAGELRRAMAADAATGPDARTAVRVLWTVGVAAAVTVALVVAVITSDLE